MRYQGRITDWKDDKGFGFVTPNGGGKNVFVHIKSFSNRQRRPVGNELVTYERKVDSRGRPQGENVAFVGNRPSQTSTPGPGIGALSFAILFFAFVTAAVIAGKLPFVVLGIYLLGSCVAFLAYALDKSAARKTVGEPQRVRCTSSAWLVAGLGHLLCATRTLRHKSKKQSFQITFWGTVVLNCAALGWLFSSAGSRALQIILGVA